MGADSPSPDAPTSDREHYGVTRGSVVKLVATTLDGTTREIAAVHNEAFPELAFFYFRDIGGLASLEGFDSHGAVVAAASEQTLSYTRYDIKG